MTKVKDVDAAVDAINALATTYERFGVSPQADLAQEKMFDAIEVIDFANGRLADRAIDALGLRVGFVAALRALAVEVASMEWSPDDRWDDTWAESRGER